MNQGPQLDFILRIDPQDTVTLFTAKVEIGQGILTALAQIAAEELDVSLGRIRVEPADTDHPLNGSSTVGSNSTQSEGGAVRQAAADARRLMLERASEQLGVPIDRLAVTDGTIRDRAGSARISYWDLQGGKPFDHPVTGIGALKSPDQYTLVGQPAPRLNLMAKVTGEGVFVHDLDLPDMAHGRVVRPPNPGAKLRSVDTTAARNLPGVLAVVQSGSFLGVIAEREEQAVKASEILCTSAKWHSGPPLPDPDAVIDHLLSRPDQPFLVVDGTPIDGDVPPIQTPSEAVHTLRATYSRPYHMHAALGPSAALAHFEDEKLTVYSHSQGVYSLRGALAQVMDLPEEMVRVRHAEGAGCYGHNGADDAALDAALLARALPGRPVLLKWMREDEHAWEPYGSCMAVRMQGSLGAGKTVIDWNHDAYSYTHSGRPRRMEGATSLLAAQYLEHPIAYPDAAPGKGHHGGIHRNADPLYAFSRRRVVKHFVPDSPLRTSALRGLGASVNVFAIEAFMDELAHAAGEDPIAFRLRHLDDDRAKEVIRTAADRAGWIADVRGHGAPEGCGRGIGFAQYRNQKCYVAVIFDVSVDRDTGRIHLERAVIAGDAGQIVNADGLASQLEGGVIQSASWTLKEEVRFDRNGITSRDWETYPVLSFSEAPEVEVVLIDRPGMPSLGAGESTQGPTPGAISNAVFDAAGIRLRQIPFTPERVKAALAAK